MKFKPFDVASAAGDAGQSYTARQNYQLYKYHTLDP